MQTSLHIGVDVAKLTLAIAYAEQPGVSLILPNERSALKRWLPTLPAGARLALEASGHYHLLLADLAQAAGLTVFVLNPRDAHYYAKAVGARAKTDRVDAQVLARWVAAEHNHLRPYQPCPPKNRLIDILLRRRAKLTTAKSAMAMSLSGLPELAREQRALIKRFEAVLARIDTHLRVLAKAAPATERLQSIVGVGPLVGIALANALARASFQNADAFVAFIGLDPRAHDSGQRRGRRRLSKRGPAELRRLLYNAAMSGAKTNVWRPLYQRERAKGLSSTAALVIIARRIARTAWSLHRHGTTFDPARLTQCLT